MSDEIAELRRQLARLQARVDELEGRSAASGPAPRPTSRRDAFKLAAGAAAGAVVGASAVTDPALAHANDLELQVINKAGGSRTQLDYTGTGNEMGFVVQSGEQFNGEAAAYPAALGGWATQAAQPNGVYAFTNQTDGWALAARIGPGSGASGAVRADGLSGTGVDASGVLGIDVTSTRNGIEIDAGHDGIRIAADGIGVAAFADNNALVASSKDAYGASVSGGVAALLLSGGVKPSPPLRTDSHQEGEIEQSTAVRGDFAVGGEFWACVRGGIPGTWRKLAGPDTAGSFHAIEPVRMFDSRVLAFPNSGRLEPNQSRTISVADGRNLAGAVIAPGAVPEGATAISFNLTVDNTGAGNFLSVVPGDATDANSSSINWSGPGQVVANGLIVGIDAARSVKVFCGDGSGGTDFIIDVNGFWR